MRLLPVLMLSLLPSIATAQIANEAGRIFGEFGRGAGEAATEGLQASWETIPPKSKEACLAESGGIVNPAFVRCRNGRQEQVRYTSSGERRVMRERPIPMQ
ncbi:MAG TPA: hypothetical protein VGE22_13680 [Solimonas sp.]